jgi:hypothetical protein
VLIGECDNAQLLQYTIVLGRIELRSLLEHPPNSILDARMLHELDRVRVRLLRVAGPMGCPGSIEVRHVLTDEAPLTWSEAERNKRRDITSLESIIPFLLFEIDSRGELERATIDIDIDDAFALRFDLVVLEVVVEVAHMMLLRDPLSISTNERILSVSFARFSPIRQRELLGLLDVLPPGLRQ